jgi:hypothetical protein
MKIRRNNTLTVAISALLLAGSHASQIQAADDAYSSQAAPPRYIPSSESYPPPPPGGWEGVIDSIDKQSQQGSDTQQQTQTTQGYSAPSYGTSQMQQPQAMPGYSTPSYGTQQMQQPQTMPGTGASGYGTQQMQQPQTMPGTGTPAYGTSQMQQLQTMPRSGTPAYGTSQMQQPQMQGYGAPGYGTPGYYRPPYGGRRDYGSDFSPWGGSGPSFKGPWDSGRGGSSMPWGGSRDMPWDSGRGGRSMPWGGSRSMPWDSGRGGRGGFMDKDRLGDAWDDMLNAPADMGEMPGGFTAPTVSVPNPVDVGDEFGTAAEDLPTQMRNVYDDNRRSNTYDSYDRGGYRR